jgi:micrococcal nuclease
LLAIASARPDEEFMRRRIGIPSRLILAITLLLLVTAGQEIWTRSGGNPREGRALVSDVVDGDTIHVGRGWRHSTVRLIGVNTPETVHPEKPIEFFGPEASAFTRRSLEGKWVHLEFEPLDRIDRYGRLLAYVFLEDGTFFNRELVYKGYARAYTRFDFRYKRDFLRAQQEARQARRGLWVKEGAEGSTSVRAEGRVIERAPPSNPPEGRIIGNVRSRVYHLPVQESYAHISEKNRVYFDTEEEAIKAGYRRAKR